MAALLLVGLGVLFLAGELEWIDVGTSVARWWPLILILVGAGEIAGRRAGWASWFLVAVGVLLLGITHGLLARDVVRWWPVVLIVLGLAMLFGARRR